MKRSRGDDYSWIRALTHSQHDKQIDNTIGSAGAVNTSSL